MQGIALIRTTNAIELLAPGRWPLGVAPAVRLGGRRQAGEPKGTLVVGEALLDVRIEMSMLAPDGTPIEVEATLVDSDAAGRWTLSGDVTMSGRTTPVTFDARYHGVFQRGWRAWAEVSFDTSVARSMWRRLTIGADVIFDAPQHISRLQTLNLNSMTSPSPAM